MEELEIQFLWLSRESKNIPSEAIACEKLLKLNKKNLNPKLRSYKLENLIWSDTVEQPLWTRYGHLYTHGIAAYSETSLIKINESAPTVSLHLIACRLNLAICIQRKQKATYGNTKGFPVKPHVFSEHLQGYFWTHLFV